MKNNQTFAEIIKMCMRQLNSYALVYNSDEIAIL